VSLQSQIMLLSPISRPIC